LGAFAALTLAAGGCELIAAVDHDLIPQGGGLVGGAGGTGGAASSSSSTTSGMGGMGGMPGCVAEECPDPGSDCLMRACEGDMCDPTPPAVAVLTPCNSAPGEGGGGGGTMAGVCDGDGACVECVDNAQCTAPEICDTTANECVPMQCQDGMMNGMETGQDCGGPVCGDCPNGQGCAGPGDCLSAFCDALVCAACTGTGAGQCLGTEYCDAGVCVPKEADGTACGDPAECSSGNCATTGQGGICCNMPCGADCQSCAMADTGTADGTCANVTAGTDPKNGCTNDATGCEDNLCAAGGVCASATGENCGSGPSCTGNMLNPQDTCDAALTCQGGTAMACPNNFVCQNGTACFTMCTAHANCVTTHFCGGVGGAGGTAGQCNAKLADTSACMVNEECQSNNCTGMVCVP